MTTPASRLFLVMNPSSRSFRSREVWPALFDGLRRRRLAFDFALTTKDGDPADLAREAVGRGFDTVVAVGGDGTINDVINGLFGPGDEQGRAAFGVLYTGTSPDFCGNHGIPLALETALDRLVANRRRRIDVCRITHRVFPDGPTVTRVFSCCANFGLGAAVARGANSGLRRRFGDLPGTLLSLVGAIARYGTPTFRLRLDGHDLAFPRLFNLFVGKGPRVASGIKLAVDIAPDDGRFYVLALHSLTKARLLALLPQVYTGRITRRFPPLFGRHLEILPCPEAPEVEYDGDPRGFLPAEIGLLPRALALV
ncbi:MAG: hypothetical protein GX442_07965 [Candidatus Riflebacteria bacterium]|nr:hypothetical protein [Candidatus Riflebacteria bacterium]